MLTLPAKVRRKKQPYLFIKTRVSRRSLVKQATVYFGELREFIAARGIGGVGPAFMRYIAVEQNGELDVEFGYFTDRVHQGGGPVRAAILPSGSFMSTQWTGPFENVHDVNAMLNGWADHNGVAWDVAETPDGTRYGCRIEIFHVTPRHVSDPRQFRTEIAIMVRSASDGQSLSDSVQPGLGSAASFSHLPIDNWRNE